MINTCLCLFRQCLFWQDSISARKMIFFTRFRIRLFTNFLKEVPNERGKLKLIETSRRNSLLFFPYAGFFLLKRYMWNHILRSESKFRVRCQFSLPDGQKKTFLLSNRHNDIVTEPVLDEPILIFYCILYPLHPDIGRHVLHTVLNIPYG